MGLTRNRGGYAILAGEVINLSNSPVYSVTVEVKFFVNSQLVMTTTGTTILPATLPNQFNMFRVLGRQFGDGDTYEAKIISWEIPSTPIYAEATMVKAGFCEEQEYHGDFCVELRNDHPVSLRNTQILVGSPSTGLLEVGNASGEGAILLPQQSQSLRFSRPPGTQPWPVDVRAAAQGVFSP